jgi:hypothetical protein
MERESCLAFPSNTELMNACDCTAFCVVLLSWPLIKDSGNCTFITRNNKDLQSKY